MRHDQRDDNDERESVFARISAGLKDLEKEIDRLDEKSRVFDDTIRREIKRRTDEYQGYRESGSTSVDALLRTTESEIAHFRENLDRSLKALKGAYEHFREEMKEDRDDDEDRPAA